MENKYINALVNFVKENDNWEELLKKNPYNLKSVKWCMWQPNWCMFVYNLFNSELTNDVVRGCRGTVLEINGKDVKVISAPYTKFFGYNDPSGKDIEDSINWKNAQIQEKCVSGDTIVQTENGFKQIKNCLEDEEVLSYNVESGKKEFCKILNKIKNDNPLSEWYEIETEDGDKIKITGNDLLLMDNETYMQVDKLKIGDSVIVS
jgi:hypothetical protein